GCGGEASCAVYGRATQGKVVSLNFRDGRIGPQWTPYVIAFVPGRLVRVSTGPTHHPTDEPDSVQPVILLTVIARQSGDCHPGNACIGWYAAARTSSRKLRDTPPIRGSVQTPHAVPSPPAYTS